MSARTMSLLPTTRINSLVTSASNGALESGVAVNDEDILLVDFQPVVGDVSSSQILRSPSANSAIMYPIPPPGNSLPSAHMVGINHNHHPSVSSEGVTTPISGAGSGKTNYPNNFSLVSLSNHNVHHHSNQTSRGDESDLNYHHHSQQPHGNNGVSLTGKHAILPYDENDEFARHQALAQPSYILNKRRSRRFVNRDNHIMWDNTNHLHAQPHVSSSLSSSEDSDTGFLMGTRKTAYTRKSVQRVVDPHQATQPGGAGGNGSPSATTGLLPNLGNRKRVRRKRPSARNRKPVKNQRDKIPNPSDVLSFCCCLCDDDQPPHSNRSNASSLRNRYFRLTCIIVIIVVIAVLASITVSLQRKVDSLDWHLKQLDQAVGSPLSPNSGNGATTNPIRKPSAQSLDTLLSAHNDLNSTVTKFKAQLEQISGKLLDLHNEINEASKKPADEVDEVRTGLANLGSRVEDLANTIGKVSENMEQLNKAVTLNANNNAISNKSDNETAHELKVTRPPVA